MASQPKCPICRNPVQGSRDNSWFPFCSQRCKLLDLSKWLSGDYRVPVQDDDDSGEVPPGGDGPLH